MCTRWTTWPSTTKTLGSWSMSVTALREITTGLEWATVRVQYAWRPGMTRLSGVFGASMSTWKVWPVVPSALAAVWITVPWSTTPGSSVRRTLAADPSWIG